MRIDATPRLPTVSTRGSAAPTSPIRKLTPFATAAEARGTHIHYLNIGQPDLETPRAVRAAIRDFDRPTIAYAPSRGLPEALHAWSAYFRHTCGVEIPPEQLLLTTGASEGLVFAMIAVADHGDDLLVLDPSYANYVGFAAVAGVTLRPLLLDPRNDYALPARERFAAAIGPRTRAILICNPNNPTGALYSRDDLQMLLTLAEEYGLFLIVDEVYRELVFDGQPQVSILTIPGAMERTIVIDSVSKRFNACGARIGCLTTANAAAMEVMMRFALARLSVSTVEQLAMIPLLCDPLSYTATVAALYERRRDAVLAALQDLPQVTHSYPRGAFYLILQLPVDDAEQFARWLLDEFTLDGETVMVAPLQGFYITPGHGANEVRLAYVLNEERLARAVHLLGVGLERYSQRSTATSGRARVAT